MFKAIVNDAEIFKSFFEQIIHGISIFGKCSMWIPIVPVKFIEILSERVDYSFTEAGACIVINCLRFSTWPLVVNCHCCFRLEKSWPKN